MILMSFLDFIRIKISISASLLAICGYLLFNILSPDLLFIFLSSFFACAAVYAYNNITDRKEDVANKRQCLFASNVWGKLIVIIFMLIGIIPVLYLPQTSITLYVLFIVIGMLYSFLRIKKYILIKNIYTAILLSLLFLFGISNQITNEIIIYYTSFFILLFAGSVISDLRDYTGDMFAGLRTLPIVLGRESTKNIVYLSLFVLMASIILLSIYPLFIFLPFIIFKIFYIRRNRFAFAHNINGILLIVFTFSLFI